MKTLQIRFFARIKEQLNCSTLSLELDDRPMTLDSLHEYLCAKDNGLWRDALSEVNIIRAVNHTVAEGDCIVHDGDEIAFFPPVTGG